MTARPRLLVAALALSLVLGACAGDDDDAVPDGSAGGPTATPESIVSPRTEGTGVTFPLSTTAPPSTATTTTLPPKGLPEDHPVPANGILALNGDSTWAQSVIVRGVPIAEVHDWFVGGVTDGGYTIINDQPRHLEFSGEGVFGTADLTKGDGLVEIVFVLGAPLG